MVGGRYNIYPWNKDGYDLIVEACGVGAIVEQGLADVHQANIS